MKTLKKLLIKNLQNKRSCKKEGGGGTLKSNRKKPNKNEIWKKKISQKNCSKNNRDQTWKIKKS